MEYIQSAREESEGCIFCEQPARGDDEAAYILARSERAFVMLNAYPYNPGHLMVAPLRHVGEYEELDEAEVAETSALLQRSLTVLKDASSPDGFNVGMNLGRVAGAGFAEHLHWHVVPRWNGDTNFMPVLGETKVLPELLSETYVKLKRRF